MAETYINIREIVVDYIKNNIDRLIKETTFTDMKVQLDEGAIMPTRAHEADAGLDLYTREDKVVSAHGYATFDTGVHIELPPNTYGKLESKSGLNVKANVVSLGGVIDEPYRGSIVVKLYNLGDTDYTFHKGEKIVQLVVVPCLYVDTKEVEKLDMNTDRKSDGFGSSGK